MSQNVEVSVVQQILIFSAPLLKINASSRGLCIGRNKKWIRVRTHSTVLFSGSSPPHYT